MYGDSCVEQMLDNNVQFVAVWKLDTLNHEIRKGNRDTDICMRLLTMKFGTIYRKLFKP